MGIYWAMPLLILIGRSNKPFTNFEGRASTIVNNTGGSLDEMAKRSGTMTEMEHLNALLSREKPDRVPILIGTGFWLGV